MPEATAIATASFHEEYLQNALDGKPYLRRILLVGPSGVGKSSLVNIILDLDGKQGAEVRSGGAPCTDNFIEYGPFDSKPLIIIDSKGVEKGNAQAQRTHILNFIRSKNRERDVSKHVHMAWYVPGDRWEECDTIYVRELRNLVEVIVTITKCDLRQDIDPETGKTALMRTREAIEEKAFGVTILECCNPPRFSNHWLPAACSRGHCKNNFSVSNSKKTWTCEATHGGVLCRETGKGCNKPYGQTELVKETYARIPDMFQRALETEQSADLHLKRKEAAGIVLVISLIALGLAGATFGSAYKTCMLALLCIAAAYFSKTFDVALKRVGAQSFLRINAIMAAFGIASGVIAAKVLMVLLPFAMFASAIRSVSSAFAFFVYGVIAMDIFGSFPSVTGPNRARPWPPPEFTVLGLPVLQAP